MKLESYFDGEMYVVSINGTVYARERHLDVALQVAVARYEAERKAK